VKAEKVCDISLKFQLYNTITIHFHSFKPITRSLSERVFKIELKIMSGKKKPRMIRIRLLKGRKREVKVDPKLGGQWNVPSLVANGM
jgi:hypothetical protein